jgi:hypothetical protein
MGAEMLEFEVEPHGPITNLDVAIQIVVVGPVHREPGLTHRSRCREPMGFITQDRGINGRSTGSRRIRCFAHEPFNFAALRRISGKPAQEFFGCRRCLLAAAGTGQRDRE